jgi:hypothetical protein
MDRDQLLAGKVDQLLGKTREVVDERNIPLLTDIIEAPDWKPAPPHAEVSPPETDWLRAELPAPSKADVLDHLSDVEIDALSQDIFSRVSQRIDAELSTALEARLSEQFQSQLNATISGVMADMKQSIANEIGDAVNAALADRLREK